MRSVCYFGGRFPIIDPVGMMDSPSEIRRIYFSQKRGFPSFLNYIFFRITGKISIIVPDYVLGSIGGCISKLTQIYPLFLYRIEDCIFSI
jgi:hypothetical protein